MPSKVRITPTLLASLEPKTEGEYTVHDKAVPGFGVRVRSSGVKSFIATYRLAGGRKGPVRRYTIGPAEGTISILDARAEAKRIIAEAQLGNDPAGEKARKRREWTVEELCKAYFEAGANNNKASTIGRDKGRVQRHIVPLLGKTRATEVTQADVERMARAIVQGKTAIDVRTKKRGRAIVRGGEGAARRVVGLLGSIFSFAVRQQIRADNPARGIRRGRDKKMERFLSPAEMVKLGDALRASEAEGLNPKALNIIRLLVFTGARKSEIAALKWSEVDLERGLLALSESKTGQKAIVLPAPAVAILSGLDRDEESPSVFPADEVDGHFKGTQKIWEKVRKKAGLSDVRLHDLRHSFASAALASGAALPVIGKLLGHGSVQTTARYAHLADDPVRRAADRTASGIARALEGKTKATVIKLKRGAKR
jgi:integrase